jgi:hypothetical protein
MPVIDNPSLGIKLQLGTEVTPGDGNGVTGANRRLRQMRLAMRDEFVDVAEYMSEGGQFVNNEVPGDRLANGTASSPLSFTECNFIYDSALKKVTASGPTNSAYTRVYRPAIPGVDVFRTYVGQKGNGRYNREWRFLHFNGFNLALTRAAATLGAPARAWYSSIVDQLTATPVKIANVVASPIKTGLFYADSLANLVAAPIRLTRNFEATLDVTGFREPFFPQNELVDTFPAVMDQPGVTAELKLRMGIDVLTPTTVAARVAGPYVVGDVVKKSSPPHTVLFRALTAGTTTGSDPAGFATAVVGQQIVDGPVTWEVIAYDFGGPFQMSKINSGGTFFVRLLTVGPVIDAATSTTYLHKVDIACQATAPYEDSDERGLATNNYTFRVVEDDTAGYPFEITTVSKMSNSDMG